MFSLHLRQIYRFSDKVLIRTLRSRRLQPPGPNPGLDNRLKSYESEGLRIEDEDAESVVEQSESDFYNVGEAYNEHMNESLMGKYEMRHRIIKEKYFKENMPNLLTWSEKEQIRHLASTEPDEWTPEKIAESFPVTVLVAKKLLKYPWKPATVQRIARHDSSVMRNWKELKEGSIDIPEDLRKHFLKFSDRSIPPLNKESIKIELSEQENIGEFESIIRRCAASEKQSPNNEHRLALPDSDTNTQFETKQLNNKKENSKRVTLEELTTKIKNRLEKGTQVDISDKIIVDTIKTGVVKNSEEITKEIELFNENIQQNSLEEVKEKNVEPNEVMNYPERIRVPKKAYKRGATYKVNDCFYDHDGKFLYRVLGMSN
ncbi:unnamed protein product [Arctia plantaginis]|uniref:Neugrin n=1 Tax=Arctia plantaginis TaxID=874455 RepID=A0A8S1AH53_ARCPL|nr:unnamed protein product [Arctia plantaginis]CAB3260693.1 unnamed protein product [Arctia plantaginis]